MSSEAFQAPSIEYLGEQLPQYAFEAYIAQGGMGAVYKARQISLDRDVAIKVLPHELGQDADFRECFSKEAKAMARLNHPNLISVFDSGDVDGMPYIVMEFIHGSSLHDAAYNQAIDPSQAATIVNGICAGLAHAHEHGIVHRDIKPANILLTARVEPKIGDFGLAHHVGSEQEGLVMGTPGYTAPEIFVDASQAGPLADIYSVGVILHQLLTGIDPAGNEGPPTHVSSNIRLDAIWRKATRPNPAERYRSVAEMGADIQKWLNSKTGSIVTSPKAGGITPSFKSQRSVAPPAVPASTSGAGGLLFKTAAIGVLLAAIWFTYGLLQDNKTVINQKIAGINGTTAAAGTPKVPEPAMPPSEPQPVQVAANPGTPAVLPPTHGTGSGTTASSSSPKPKPADLAVQKVPDLEPAPAPPRKPKGPPPVGPAPRPGSNLPPGDPVLLERATALILDARKKRDASMLKNARSLQSLLRDKARHAEEGEADFLKQFAEACNGGVLPDTGGTELGSAVAAAYGRAQREQAAADRSYQTEIARIRDFYVPKLRTAAEAADAQLKPRLLAQADAATDLAAWVAKLAPEAPRQAVALKPSNRGFVGNWDVLTDNQTQWVADADGVVTINDGQWKGKTAVWKMMPDGTVEVSWPDKPRPYVLSPNGNGWSGKTSFGQPVTLTPGKW